jgi:hypothetical protein
VDKDISVAKCDEENWEITFRRMLGPAEVEEWSQLNTLLDSVHI